MIPKVLVASEKLSSGLLWDIRLQAKNIAFVPESNLSHVIRSCLAENPDLIVLDYNPYDPKGMNLIRELREVTTVPLLILLPTRDADFVLRVYEAGADDCIVTPIEPPLFLAKVNAWLKRRMSLPTEMQNPLRVGAVHLIPMDRVASLDNGGIIHLTSTETRLLYVLMSRAGRTIPTEELIERVWMDKEDGEDTLKSMIYRLRQKLEKEPATLHCILNVPGVGYKFELSAEQRAVKDGEQDMLQIDKR